MLNRVMRRTPLSVGPLGVKHGVTKSPLPSLMQLTAFQAYHNNSNMDKSNNNNSSLKTSFDIIKDQLAIWAANVPKGFGKYFPPEEGGKVGEGNGKVAGEQTNSSPKENGSETATGAGSKSSNEGASSGSNFKSSGAKSGGGGGGGFGGGGKKTPDPGTPMGMILSMLGSSGKYK